MTTIDSLKKRIEENSETIFRSIADTLRHAIEGETTCIKGEEYKIVWRINTPYLSMIQNLGLIEKEPIPERRKDSFIEFATAGFPVTNKGFEEYEKLKAEGFYNS